MTLPQPEIYRDYEIVPIFHYLDVNGNYRMSDWVIIAVYAEMGNRRSRMTLSEVKESIDDLLNQ